MFPQLVRINALDREPELLVHRDMWWVIQDGLTITKRISAKAAVVAWNDIATRLNKQETQNEKH